MAMIDFGIDGAGKSAGEGFTGYEGPLPPKGVYRGILKRMELKKTGPQSKTPGTPMLFLIFEVKETGEKSKYNGAPAMANQMITDQGAGYVNQILHAIAGSTERGRKLEKLFWGGKANVVKDEKGKEHINKIGPFVVGKPGSVELPVAVRVDHKTWNNEQQLDIKQWYPAPEEDAEDEVVESDDVISSDEVEGGDLDVVDADNDLDASDLDEDDPF